MIKKEKGVSSVEKEEFSRTRRYLGKTQSQMAQLLGISLKPYRALSRVGETSRCILNVRCSFFCPEEAPS